MVGFWCALFGFMFHLKEIIANQPRKDVCQDNREEFGWALIGHDYKSSTADNFGRCFFDCSLDEKCQSATFHWNTKECQMKKETKKSRPMDLEENPAATYMENPYRAEEQLFKCFSRSGLGCCTESKKLSQIVVVKRIINICFVLVYLILLCGLLCWRHPELIRPQTMHLLDITSETSFNVIMHSLG